MKMLQTRREKGLVSGVLAVGLVSLVWFAYNGYATKRGELEISLKRATKFYDSTVRRLKAKKDIKARYARTQKLSIPGGESLVQITIRDEIDAVLQEAGISSRYDWDPLPIDEPKEDIRVYYAKIDNLSTTMPKLALMLAIIDREGSVLEVDDLRLRGPGKRGGNESIRVSLIISRIVFQQPKGGK